MGIKKNLSADFDIKSFLNFHPPDYFCARCFAIGICSVSDILHQVDGGIIRCQICGQRYPSEDNFLDTSYQVINYLRGSGGYGIKFDKSVEHSKNLASIGASFSNYGGNPINILYAALSCAEAFIHFTTYGISHQFIGALKVIAQRVDIRGTVSNVDTDLANELDEHTREEAYRLNLRFFKRTGDRIQDSQHPHQKLIIIDGLLAFKGSTNLTLSGWRNAAKGRDTIEVVTNIKQVQELNNSLFSPVWAEFEPESDQGIPKPLGR